MKGKYGVLNIRLQAKLPREERAKLAGSAEQHSVHPLAVAIQKYVKANAWEVP